MNSLPSIGDIQKYAMDGLVIGGVAAGMNLAGVDRYVGQLISPLVGPFGSTIGSAVAVGGVILITVIVADVVMGFVKTPSSA